MIYVFFNFNPSLIFREFDKLPENAKIYVKELEKFIQAKISSISTSAERKDTILIENVF